MFDKDFFSDLAHRLTASLPENLHQLKADCTKNFQAILEKSFSKMNLVTREEFDTQSQVLQRTRLLLEQLEQQVAQLQAQQTTPPSDHKNEESQQSDS